MSVAIKKYRPHLPTLMSLCDINYMLLLRILADKEQVDEQRCFFISDFLSYRVVINEVTRYTTLLTISQEANISGYNLSALFRPKMVVRLYHDARMAEVISNQDVKQIKPRYDYPNDKMHLPDEKQQINFFLKEWLQLCLQRGQIHISVAANR
jgi:uncharacterized protein YqiB (DUF1249 family)